MKKNLIIIGCGPAGLTSAYELLKQSNEYNVILLEGSNDIGGISKTVNYKNNRIDIGGHRFFSKSQTVMNWWQNILPVQGSAAYDYKELGIEIEYSTLENAPDPDKKDNLFLIRHRLSRILFLKKFFNYPISLSKETIENLGIARITKIGFSYINTKLAPIKDERTLEQFFINRFGKELYKTFFRDYTEKVWGVPCSEIKAEWGAQRIKGLSITKTLTHALSKLVSKKEIGDINQKNVETSLIERFLYPKYGPGQMWERVAQEVEEMGGMIFKNHLVTQIEGENKKVKKVIATHENKLVEFEAEHVISTMPIKDLVSSLNHFNQPLHVNTIASNLMYRDFITVGVLLNKLKITNTTDIKSLNNIVPDNWIYIQEPDVQLGRLQIFNNWSPYMVEDINKVWIGLEYFCNEGDDLWSKDEEQMKKLAIEELENIGMIDKNDVLDSVVIKVPKAYPAYFGSYEQFDDVKEFLDTIPNLYCVGRNGMHKYNNMDHSMLSAMEAVKNILNGVETKDNIWSVNAEKEYHESK